MVRAIAINGSPRMERGITALLLNAFIGGMEEGGAQTEILYASKLKVKPCGCGELRCWNELDGECCIQDSMQQVYPILRAADILVLATPMYIPLPGEMQNVINRIVALMLPKEVIREGRTRVRMREDVNIRKVVLVAIGGWWEIENLDTLVRIAREFAEDASVEFAGALLRPHAAYLKTKGENTDEAQAVLDAARRAGIELAVEGKMSEETLARIRQPFVERTI